LQGWFIAQQEYLYGDEISLTLKADPLNASETTFEYQFKNGDRFVSYERQSAHLTGYCNLAGIGWWDYHSINHLTDTDGQRYLSDFGFPNTLLRWDVPTTRERLLSISGVDQAFLKNQNLSGRERDSFGSAFSWGSVSPGKALAYDARDPLEKGARPLEAANYPQNVYSEKCTFFLNPISILTDGSPLPTDDPSRVDLNSYLRGAPPPRLVFGSQGCRIEIDPVSFPVNGTV
jgi:hypothetical protein